ncbi:MAG: hypothetical protein IVW53_00785 [Chloroflexi bacterium]|nr:hypothetical protein [Chloroflexota bacterium]
MQTSPDIRLRLARERRDAQILAAADARVMRRPEDERTTAAGARRPFRRALGNRMIAFGTRLAADPGGDPIAQPARTR